jgi:beta-lactamase regulating signal transducer with metallopeptidase domain
MNLELLCERVVEALVNGGYQGLLLTAVVLSLLWMMRRSSAATRHNICLVTLLLVALLPAAHFARSMSMFAWFAHDGGGEPVEDVGVAAMIPAGSRSQIQRMPEGTKIDTESIQPEPHSFVSRARNLNFETARDQENATGLLDRPSVERQNGAANLLAFNKPEATALNRRIVISLSSRQCMLLVMAVVVIGFIRLGGLARQLWFLRELKRTAEPVSGEVRKRFNAISAEMKIPRVAALLVAPETRILAPCAIGFRRPVVVVPRRILEENPEKVEAIFRHELAHLDRRDDWTALFQQVINAFLFFHPAVWMLSRRLNVEREIACDDRVLAAQPGRKTYALLLTEFAGRFGGDRFIAAPAAWGRRTQLKRRIDMILNRDRNISPRASRQSVGIIGATVAVMAALGLGFAPQIALAQSADEPPEAAVANEEAVSEDFAPPRPSAAPRPSTRWAPVPAKPVGPRLAVTAVPAVPGIVPYIAAEPAAPAEPARRKAGGATENDDSIERRLDRLEKMIEELAQKGEKGGAGKPQYFPSGGFSGGARGFAVDPKEMARLQREIERSAKNLEDLQLNFNVDGAQQFHWEGKNLKAHRKALEAQRKVLEKQLASLNAQIDRLGDEERAEDEAFEEGKEKQKSKIKNKLAPDAEEEVDKEAKQ